VTEERADAATLAGLLAEIVERHGDRLAEVLRVCSFVVDGAPAGGRDPAAVALPPEAEVEVLPPFAGG
jgi:molybdopterin synthase sulfur carrier subunit